MPTHTSILAWRIPWTEEPGGYSPWGCKEMDMTEPLTPSLSLFIAWDAKLIVVGGGWCLVMEYT